MAEVDLAKSDSDSTCVSLAGGMRKAGNNRDCMEGSVRYFRVLQRDERIRKVG